VAGYIRGAGGGAWSWRRGAAAAWRGVREAGASCSASGVGAVGRQDAGRGAREAVRWVGRRAAGGLPGLVTPCWRWRQQVLRAVLELSPCSAGIAKSRLCSVIGILT